MLKMDMTNGNLLIRKLPLLLMLGAATLGGIDGWSYGKGLPLAFLELGVGVLFIGLGRELLIDRISHAVQYACAICMVLLSTIEFISPDKVGSNCVSVLLVTFVALTNLLSSISNSQVPKATGDSLGASSPNADAI
jgi:hypothetical protein